MRELGLHHDQRQRVHYVTLWHSVTVLTLPRTSFASTALLKAGCHENRLAQSKRDRSHAVLDSEDIGSRAP